MLIFSKQTTDNEAKDSRKPGIPETIIGSVFLEIKYGMSLERYWRHRVLTQKDLAWYEKSFCCEPAGWEKP